MLFARQFADEGWDVSLVGLTSGQTRSEGPEAIGSGSLEVLRIHRSGYKKQNFFSRVVWTVASNLMLLRAAYCRMRRADTILFTGSPPLMLHFILPLNLLLRRRLIYRITDFHPECSIAESKNSGLILALLLRLTHFWRRKVDSFEVLGFDQAKRLVESGIAKEKIRLKRDPSPVSFSGAKPLQLPEQLQKSSGVILYSGNWGVAHDEKTFVEGYLKYLVHSKSPLRLWLNATGAKASTVEEALRSKGIPIYRSDLVPIEDLPSLLLAADIHLITLSDPFIGYVLPSKIHACIESRKRILFIGSQDSDVHLLAKEGCQSDKYERVDVGDVDKLVNALFEFEQALLRERNVEAPPVPVKAKAKCRLRST
jgi:hypothetical protein